MRSERLHRVRLRGLIAAAVAGAVLAAACEDSLGPSATLVPADTIIAGAVSMTAVRLEWARVDDIDVVGYRIERRSDLAGPFTTAAERVPQVGEGHLVYFDPDLEPDTYYGYRIVTLSRLGTESGPSVVRGVRTPPRPAILVRTRTTLETPGSLDQDGYVVRVRNSTDSSWTSSVGQTGERRFGPLRPGAYHVALSGLATNCQLSGQPDRDASVADSGVATVDTVVYNVECFDPSYGRVTALVVAQGDSLDVNGYRIDFTGEADDQALPDSLRVVAETRLLNDPAGGSANFDRLRPGDYEVVLSDVAPQCSLAGPATQPVRVDPLTRDTVRFDVTCAGTPVDTTAAGYRLTHQWSAVQGGRITLTIRIDMGTFNDPAINGSNPDDVSAIQGGTVVDTTKLRFVSGANVPGAAMDNATAGITGNRVSWLNFTTSTALLTGSQGIVVLTFDVVGTGTTATRTTITAAGAASEASLLGHIVVVDASVNLGGGGSGTNQSPTAEANGPYSGTVGAPLALSAAGSSDPDGTITSYAWTYGDGGGGSGAQVSHTYTAAGTFRARLTVTDNQGATAVDSATVTITGGGGGNLSPVAQANGPYAGTAGVPISFSAAGSSDPDGQITAYSWDFGDGSAPGSSAGVVHSYAAGGSYIATLTVTDNQGATGTAQASVTVSAGGGGGAVFTWSNAFGGIGLPGGSGIDSVVFLTISLDLSTDITETPGPESLATFVLDSLKYDASVLRFFSFAWGPGGSGSTSRVESGAEHRITASGTLGTGNQTGLITIARVGFHVVAGSSGRSVTTKSFVGALTGTAGTGFYAYRPRVGIREATLTIP